MASQRTLWTRLGKVISGVVVLCFFLPFFGVSCDGVDVITVSGADMVGGCKPGGMINAMGEGTAGGGAQLSAKIDSVDVEPIAIVAMACVVLVFGMSWLRERRALLGAFVLSIAALGALTGLYVKISGDMASELAAETERQSTSALGKDLKIDAGGRFGLWMSGLGLLGIAALTGLALRQRDTVIPTATALPRDPMV